MDKVEAMKVLHHHAGTLEYMPTVVIADLIFNASRSSPQFGDEVIEAIRAMLPDQEGAPLIYDLCRDVEDGGDSAEGVKLSIATMFAGSMDRVARVNSCTGALVPSVSMSTVEEPELHFGYATHGLLGTKLIEAERKRQMEKYKIEDDDRLHSDGELAAAAVAYIASGIPEAVDFFWPWGEDGDEPPRLTPDDRIAELVRAGALIAAEIDRLGRLPNNSSSPVS